MKTNVRLTFLGYKRNGDGEIVRVGKPHEDEDQSVAPALTLTGFENGLCSGEKVSGQISVCKDKLHDLLNGEAMDGMAIFGVEIVD